MRVTLFILFAFRLQYAVLGQPGEQKQPIKIGELINAVFDSFKKHFNFHQKEAHISAFLQVGVQSNAYANLINDPKLVAQLIATDIDIVHQDPHLPNQFGPGFKPQVAYHPA